MHDLVDGRALAPVGVGHDHGPDPAAVAGLAAGEAVGDDAVALGHGAEVLADERRHRPAPPARRERCRRPRRATGSAADITSAIIPHRAGSCLPGPPVLGRMSPWTARRDAAGRIVGATGRSIRRAGSATGRGATYTVRQARRASHAEGAGDSGLYRLIELHAFNAAGDAAVAISLAGTLFFAQPGEARGPDRALPRPDDAARSPSSPRCSGPSSTGSATAAGGRSAPRWRCGRSSAG